MGRTGLDHLLSYCYAEALDQSLRVWVSLANEAQISMYRYITLTSSLCKQMEMQATLTDSIHILPENQGTLSLQLNILGQHLTSRFRTSI